MAIVNNAPAKKAPAKRVPQAEFEIGNYFCRIAQVIDLGLQHKREWDDINKKYYPDLEKAPVNMLMVTYEFVTEFMKDENGNDVEDKPRWLSEDFPLYPLKSDLATSTKRYNAIDPKHEKKGDWSQLGAYPCTVTIAHKKSGKAKIGNVAPPMKGMAVPELKNPVKIFDLSAPDLDIFRSLPEWLQERIKANLEYEGSALQKLLAGGVVGAQDEPLVKEVVEEGVGEDAVEPQVVEEEDNDNPW